MILFFKYSKKAFKINKNFFALGNVEMQGFLFEIKISEYEIINIGTNIARILL